MVFFFTGGNMPILQQVLKTYENILMPYKYEINFKDSKENIETIIIEFKHDNIKHLLGIHKIPPYDESFKNRKTGKLVPRYSGKLIFQQIKSGKLKYLDLLNQSKSEEVTIRIIHFLELSYLLDSNFTKKLYSFDSTKYNGHSQINSKFIIYLDKVSFSLNFGIASSSKNGKTYYYPETWFVKERDKDKYIENQEEFEIVSICKIKKEGY